MPETHEGKLPLHSASLLTGSWRTESRTAYQAYLCYRWPWSLEGLQGLCSPASHPQVWPASTKRAFALLSADFQKDMSTDHTSEIWWLIVVLLPSAGAVLHRWLCWGSPRHWRLGLKWCSQMMSGSPETHIQHIFTVESKNTNVNWRGQKEMLHTLSIHFSSCFYFLEFTDYTSYQSDKHPSQLPKMHHNKCKQTGKATYKIITNFQFTDYNELLMLIYFSSF